MVVDCLCRSCHLDKLGELHKYYLIFPQIWLQWRFSTHISRAHIHWESFEISLNSDGKNITLQLMSKVWGSNCRKALSLKGTIKKRRKMWMRSWSVVNEGKRSAKTSFGWKRRFVRERPTTARRPSPPRARGDAFICFLMWAGGADQKRLGSSDDNSAIKRSPGQTCSVTPGQFQMGDLHTCSLLGSSIVLKLESSQLNNSSSYIPSVAISVRLTLLNHNFVISPLISFNLASLPWCKVSAPSSWNTTPFIWTFHVRC